MRAVKLYATALALSLFSTVALAADELRTVQYLSDTVTGLDAKYLRLQGGSEWMLSFTSMAIAGSPIIIVIETEERDGGRPSRVATAYLAGDALPVRYISGRYVPKEGFLTDVEEANADGAVLRLADGTSMAVQENDRKTAGNWRTPYPALLSADKGKLWNLKRGKGIAVTAPSWLRDRTGNLDN